MKNIYKQLIIVIVLLSGILCQEIPNEFLEFHSQNILYDVGEGWESNTILGSPRFQDLNNNSTSGSDSLYAKLRGGFHVLNKAAALYGFGNFTFKKYFYGYLYARIVNNGEEFLGYTGIPRDISRAGFNSGETDISGLGFQNDWFNFQFGRGRESWGAGNNIQIALNGNSSSYDYGLIRLNFGQLRLKYIHGFLESIDNGTNRYITARGIEWANQKSILIGFSEIVIYSGLNRPLDIGYLNPISSHLEIELNDRLNIQGHSDANAIWQVSLDWLINQRFRISGNYIIDEFVLDSKIQTNKEHGKAYSLKTLLSLIKNNSLLFNIHSSLIYVGTPTFRHGTGSNNFIQRNKPLGWEYGSDGTKISLGIDFFNRKNLITKIEVAKIEVGEESIINRPYDAYADYLKGKFPSGTINKSIALTSEFQFWFKSNISFMGNVQIKKIANSDTLLSGLIGFNIFLPKSIKIEI